MAVTMDRLRGAFTPEQEAQFHVWLADNSVLGQVRAIRQLLQSGRVY